MRTRKLEIACPACGSKQVFYTCTPNCCYNHICAECGATFEPVTRPAGGALSGVAPPDPLPDASDPAAPCPKCDSPTVYLIDDGSFVCGACGALLLLNLLLTPGS